ncbi:MAG TPA: Mur ligase family protein [Woeseiaceae bacterium]|nr:Mur ligase family protein [Woeseiaceae bacterium]
MEFLDARRLTGPNLLLDEPAAVLDVGCTAREAHRIGQRWRSKVAWMLRTLGWPATRFGEQVLEGGASFAFAARIDTLYTAAEINEWAWAAVLADLEDAPVPDTEASLASIRNTQQNEANPRLLELQDAAEEHGITLLWDDDEVSLGLGRGATVWPARQLPETRQLDWQSFTDLPIGLVTGTNGKTTSVRLASHILQGGGRNVGCSSTDWIAVNERILDRGDWSGPGGARAVLRQNDIDVAVLESARGGLVRRGLGVRRADAALITNIAEDHLGDFGSRNLDEILGIKWITSRAVQEGGVLILNADDTMLLGKAKSYPGRITWFSLDADNPEIRRHVEAGGTAWLLDSHQLVRQCGSERELLCADRDIPITLGGRAKHNVANALAAAALANALGATLGEIRHGLTSMSQDLNPGRCNVYEVGGRSILVDFAHNPHAMRALFDMAEALPARRRALCFGQAGDRPDSLIRAMTKDAFAIGLDKIYVSELKDYYRGRQPGEVYAVIRDELLRLGATDSQIEHRDLETESLCAALEWARDGDLVIMLALGESAKIIKIIQELGEPISMTK